MSELQIGDQVQTVMVDFQFWKNLFQKLKIRKYLILCFFKFSFNRRKTDLQQSDNIFEEMAIHDNHVQVNKNS